MLVELPYTLHTRYASIAIAWSVILVPTIGINLGIFYYLLHKQGGLDLVVLTTPTAVLGIFTVAGIVERVWKLVRKSPEYRPLGASRYSLDIFQWGYFSALLLISALISSALGRDDNDHDGHVLQLRLISLPSVVLMAFLATLTLISLILCATKIRLPFRFGSLAAGNTVRPAIYYIVEDIVAVDGCGKGEYREAFMARYDSSPIFQSMFWRLSVAWMLAFYALAVAFGHMIFLLPWQAVYPIGWAGPFPIVGVLVIATTLYVQRKLREEREQDRDGTIDERTALLAAHA